MGERDERTGAELPPWMRESWCIDCGDQVAAMDVCGYALPGTGDVFRPLCIDCARARQIAYLAAPVSAGEPKENA